MLQEPQTLNPVSSIVANSGNQQPFQGYQPTQSLNQQPFRNYQDTTANSVFSGYQYPTPPNSAFARAMSQITSNPTSANQGRGDNQFFNRELFEQLQMALTIQMGLNGPQQVKERALHNILTSKSARGDMKQVLQSRAEIYGDELDPNWFKQKVDLGGKASTLKEKNQARSQLAGAPLLVAQVEELEFRKRMMEGDVKALLGLRMGSQTTVAALLKVLGKIPPLSLITLCNKECGAYMKEHLLQHNDDLDFVQDVLSSTGGHQELNQTLNGVLAGFSRRKQYGRFKCGQLNLDFDRLRFASTITPKDSDLYASEVVKKTKLKSKQSNFLSVCRYFQRPEGCHFGANCSFLHQCVICNKPAHGATDCPTRKTESRGPNDTKARDTKARDRPPHPRFRRDRAR